MRISDWSSDVCSSDLVGPVPGQQAVDQVAVADVDLDENMRRFVLQRRKRIEVARVREGVEVDHADAAGDRLEHEIAADEAGSAGYKPGWHAGAPCDIGWARGNCRQTAAAAMRPGKHGNRHEPEIRDRRLRDEPWMVGQS